MPRLLSDTDDWPEIPPALNDPRIVQYWESFLQMHLEELRTPKRILKCVSYSILLALAKIPNQAVQSLHLAIQEKTAIPQYQDQYGQWYSIVKLFN